MTDASETDSPGYDPIEDVPIQSVNVYARLWQFETWLRTMIYVELRALLGDDWALDLKTGAGPFQADKSLTHMPTPEMNALSYSQLSSLLKLIEKHWQVFECYLPPKAIWEAKLQEIIQIRHRAAHFRVGHADDLARLRQFLRDIDKGFWHFCTSYNDINPILPQSSDPITSHFLQLDPLPWSEIGERKWAQVGSRDKSLPVGLTVNVTRRLWASAPAALGVAGHFYDFQLFAQDGREFEIGKLLERTRELHVHLAHLILDDAASVRLTVPSILGGDAIVGLVERFHEAAVYSVRRGGIASGRDTMSALARRWPEYVLGPDSPLTFLGPDMECSFFSA